MSGVRPTPFFFYFDDLVIFSEHCGMNKLLFLAMLMVSGKTAAAQWFPKKELTRLKNWMQGDFSVVKQYPNDSSQHSTALLHIRPVWQHRKDGYWLFADCSQQDLQELVHLYQQDDSTLVLQRFTVYPPASAGALSWSDSLQLADFSTEWGCAFYFSRKGKHFFEGNTASETCGEEPEGTYRKHYWKIGSQEMERSEYKLADPLQGTVNTITVNYKKQRRKTKLLRRN